MIPPTQPGAQPGAQPAVPPGARSRRAELAAGLETVERRIADACAAAGRPREEVTLVVVTKFFPASDVRLLAEAGVRHVAESRHQEGVDKREECHDLDLVWHFVGGLQSNKAAAVGAWADVVHSVDRAKLLLPLGRAAAERLPGGAPGGSLEVLVQVCLDPEPDAAAARGAGARSGVRPEAAVALAQRAAATEGLRLRGVMAVAPRGGDPVRAFAALAAVADDVRTAVLGATWVSAGMSGDLEAAVAAGATHVRVGTAVLGNRPPRG